VDFDLGMPMHEIRFMRAAGMTPMQIIPGTGNAARVCNLGRRPGTIQRGRIADLIVVAGNPLGDIEALRNVTTVVHGGRLIRGRARA
jgi:imidazolonepropionase-like amidohydrolase